MSKFKILFVLLVFLTNTSQAQTAKSFIGKWLFQDLVTADKKYAAGVEMMKKASAGMVYYFDENFQYYTKTFSREQGTWVYDETKKTITMTNNQGKSEFFVIIKATESLLLVDMGKEMGMLTLKKVPTEASDIIPKTVATNKFVSTTAKDVCKKWFVQTHESPVYSAEQVKAMSPMFKGTFHEFKADFTYIKGGVNNAMTGKWEFGKDNKSITTIVNNNRTLWSIKSISATELLLVKGTEDDVWRLSIKE